MPDEVNSKIRMYADDAKIYREIKSEIDCNELQNDLNKLQAWSQRWQLKFNPQKCSVVNVGKKSIDYMYTVSTEEGEIQLNKTTGEKDLGVYIDTKLTYDEHITSIVSKANRMIGLVWRSFSFIDTCLFNKLYKAVIRPHLEYTTPVWSPHLWRQAELLENCQRRATKMIPCIRDQSYEERLRYLKLPTLVFRRLRGDLIHVFKYLKGYYKNGADLFTLCDNDRTRGHNLKLRTKQCKSHQRMNFFTQRTITWWNALPQYVVDSETVNMFKNKMDSHFEKNFAFGPNIIKTLRKVTDLPFQAHLDIENPGEYIDLFIDSGCNIVTVHPQTCDMERNFL